jgi:HD-GYP domain-containing protein (c-di-GMP phosphodiesterase class II)
VTALPLTLGLSAGALLVRERRARRNAERLAAALLETLLNAIDATDAQTGAHVRRVARYALILADAAELDRHAQRSVERVALFHDIGKISEALFDIIHDERSLTPEERRAIATHPARGAEVLAPLEAFYPDLADGVLAHHECWDGTGYPRRLAGEAIPYVARIVSIADTFDAVTASRRYRSGKGVRAGADTVSRGRGTQFDPALADLFLCPPVFERVLQAQRDLAAERPRRAERRAGRIDPAPDVKFRWRSATPAPLPKDPEIRTLP